MSAIVFDIYDQVMEKLKIIMPVVKTTTLLLIRISFTSWPKLCIWTSVLFFRKQQTGLFLNRVTCYNYMHVENKKRPIVNLWQINDIHQTNFCFQYI